MDTQIDWEHFASNWWQTLLFCLGVYILVFTIRKAVEWKWPVVTGKDTFWEDVALPTMPWLFGALIALVVKSYPYPAVIHTAIARVFYGAVCGFFSAWVYKVIKSLAKSKLGVEVPDSTPPPGPLP